ncbi:MAG: hypothetical protein GY851_19780, partial [bacterium]|nr:hypothetical protein [bacterium]
MLPFAKARTRTHFDCDGPVFPEPMYFWGSYAQDNYGRDRGDLPVGVTENRYIRYHYDGILEVVAIMIDYHTHTGDARFLREELLPIADAALAFFFGFYDLDADGRLRMEPAQSLETWQKVINPLPPIAGIQHVTEGLLALPADLTTPAQRDTWARMQRQLPELPTTEIDGERAIAAAAEILEEARNSENPELYAVFPYRLFGVGMPDLDMARRTFEQRRVKDHHGWRQDEIQAARLGLSAEASDRLLKRFSEKDSGSRFPAFWGPNFDWIPDQDHGTSGQMALQTMLLQNQGRRMILFPAWPVDWNVEFKLHAAHNTTVQGVYRDGIVKELVVTPAEREADLLMLLPQ